MSLLVMLTEMSAKLDAIMQKNGNDNTPVLDAIGDLKKEIVGEPDKHVK